MPAPIQKDPEAHTYSLGDFKLRSGEVLEETERLMNDEALTFSTDHSFHYLWYSGTITAGNEWLISTTEHRRQSLDPSKFFIVIPAHFGNGKSTSPSNTPREKGGVDPPKATFFDNVRAQHQLITKHFGIRKI